MAPVRIPVAVALTALLFCAPLSDDGVQLFHKMQNALGGADKITAVRDFEQTERAETWFPDGQPRGSVTKRVRFIRPSFLRIDQTGPGDTYALYFDGTSGWEILPDGKVQDLTAGELRFAQGYLYGLQLNQWLADRDPDIVLSSPAPNVLSFSVRGDSKHRNEITLDPLTSLPSSEKGISLADPDHPVASETRLEGWHAVDGIKFPGRIINVHDGKKLADITVEQTRLNRGLKPADLGRKPADGKPVMNGP
jgi:hypothetical protein